MPKKHKVKAINVYWWRVREGKGNFGDELSPYLISKLTGRPINQILIPSSGHDYFYKAISQIYHKVIPLKYIPLLIKQYFIQEFIAGIGSIISILNKSSCHVWGSGIIKIDDKINPAHFHAVRGKYTQIRLNELNLSVPSALGDPSLLLPIVYKPQINKTHKIGIIPHHIHYNDVSMKIKDHNVKVINLLDDIETIIDEINKCEYIISTSLHGIIVPQAYGIPSLWFTYDEKPLFGDNIKFYDYFSSVGIVEYLPFKLIPEQLNKDVIINLFKKYSKYSKINKPLIQIQKELINAAPFAILDKYMI